MCSCGAPASGGCARRRVAAYLGAAVGEFGFANANRVRINTFALAARIPTMHNLPVFEPLSSKRCSRRRRSQRHPRWQPNRLRRRRRSDGMSDLAAAHAASSPFRLSFRLPSCRLVGRIRDLATVWHIPIRCAQGAGALPRRFASSRDAAISESSPRTCPTPSNISLITPAGIQTDEPVAKRSRTDDRRQGELAVSLTRGQINAVRAAFKAGIKPGSYRPPMSIAPVRDF